MPDQCSWFGSSGILPGALDWRHRHQSPALVIDHWGISSPCRDFGRRGSSSQSVCAALLIPFETRLLSCGATQHPGADRPSPIEPAFVDGAASAPAAINRAERRVVFRQRVECGSDQGLVRSEPCWPHENGLCIRRRRQLWRHSGGHDALARRARDISGYGRGLQRRRLERRLLCGGSNAGRRSATRNHLARIASA